MRMTAIRDQKRGWYPRSARLSYPISRPDASRRPRFLPLALAIQTRPRQTFARL
jgi:hypothetical protein